MSEETAEHFKMFREQVLTSFLSRRPAKRELLEKNILISPKPTTGIVKAFVCNT